METEKLQDRKKSLAKGRLAASAGFWRVHRPILNGEMASELRITDSGAS
jgi:hypothetical protein